VNTPPLWLQKTAAGWQLRLHIQPGARKTESMGEHGTALKIRINAPPVDGKANQELLDWLRHQLKIPARSMVLIAGQTSRQKVIALMDERLTSEQIVNLLLQPAAPG